jgi:large subunit ribosomal protein L3
LILIKGAVPGPKSGWVLIKDAVKRALPDDAPRPAGLKTKADAKAAAPEAAPSDAPAEETTKEGGES